MSTLTTDRLVLRPFREGDAKMMYRNWRSDENVARYCHWQKHENLNTTIWLLQMYLDEAASGFEFRWAITEKGNDEPIGAIDIVGVTDDDKTAEIGYVLSKKYWGKGYVTEAYKAVIDELFRNGFTKIIAAHHVDNPASGRVMEKCGMTFVGYDKSVFKWGSDKPCDVKLYELLK
ncbi:MAG: GNAT family N-acetyltransferase [Clostridia bacterium]|nr:GNAT family N-acetyltransferase [Clostridia bacterium]